MGPCVGPFISPEFQKGREDADSALLLVRALVVKGRETRARSLGAAPTEMVQLAPMLQYSMMGHASVALRGATVHTRNEGLVCLTTRIPSSQRHENCTGLKHELLSEGRRSTLNVNCYKLAANPVSITDKSVVERD